MTDVLIGRERHGEKVRTHSPVTAQRHTWGRTVTATEAKAGVMQAGRVKGGREQPEARREGVALLGP